MASNSATNKPSRKPHARIVQPALPLIPGLKRQKPKPITLEREPEKVDLGQDPQSSADDEKFPRDTESGVDVADSAASRDGDSGEKVTPPSIGSEPVTPQPSHSTAPEEIATEAHNDNEDNGKEVEAGDSDVQARHDVSEVTETTNLEITEPTNELPATETDYGHEAITGVNGRLLESLQSPAEEGGKVQPDPDMPGLVFADKTEPIPTSSYANGIDSSESALDESGVFASQSEDTNSGYQDAQPPVTFKDGFRDPAVNGYHQPSITPYAVPVVAPRSFNTLPSLQEHLLLLNSTKEGVDILLQVNPTNAQPFVSYSHSVILFRSLRLRRLVTRQQQANNNYPGNVISLYPARPIMAHAFEAALRFLYSDTVLGKEFFVQPHPGADFQAVRVHNLEYILSYWVSGIELGLEPVSICAERLLGSYLDWDVLELAYRAAVELANSPMSSHGKNMIGSDYLIASSSIIKLILQFLATHIDIKNFKLDSNSTASTIIPSRLPQFDDGRPKHNPALASMVFGSMPSSADMSPSSPQSEILPPVSTFKDTVASNILLNVDFENLNIFNNFVQAPTIRDAATTKLMVDVVNEREARRQKMYTSRIPNKDRMANSAAWEAVGLKESITEGNVLTRERVGFLISSK
ncbi:uncharacterized protein Z520_03396 [Fonsecaea multimorphosa CBS 102226]|uniref:Uncharacterized protein n=1 Tax=Fonsecaea multimorphosa CBS 102226 TaxID=1442371 RepID=A0A0D2HFL3_9EURO|nr:uncharacterized protein Z520_03396 [Fonsecaea multimorphosa CBS 102226]KIY00731.1 hypothetical protein Z520_03396 [Fonsecaea multimorphosa CBS 102226]OAL27775.1 hypothetical protein AYO22_03317 [Fonsecaea multimorphosa]